MLNDYRYIEFETTVVEESLELLMLAIPVAIRHSSIYIPLRLVSHLQPAELRSPHWKAVLVR